MAIGGVAITTTWASLTAPERMWRHRVLPALGTGPAAVALAIVGWDFIYYWNHRFMHESRYMWALHVVHHSSERYNLSTALRQPVADALGTSLPYGTLCLLGVAPELIMTARGVNLLYQFWIHTETIGRLGAPEAVLNTPSHHRVHQAPTRSTSIATTGASSSCGTGSSAPSSPRRNRAVYGLTKNINSFNVGTDRRPRVRGHDPRRGQLDQLEGATLLRAQGPGMGNPTSRLRAEPGGRTRMTARRSHQLVGQPSSFLAITTRWI